MNARRSLIHPIPHPTIPLLLQNTVIMHRNQGYTVNQDIGSRHYIEFWGKGFIITADNGISRFRLGPRGYCVLLFLEVVTNIFVDRELAEQADSPGLRLVLQLLPLHFLELKLTSLLLRVPIESDMSTRVRGCRGAHSGSGVCIETQFVALLKRQK